MLSLYEVEEYLKVPLVVLYHHIISYKLTPYLCFLLWIWLRISKYLLIAWKIQRISNWKCDNGLVKVCMCVGRLVYIPVILRKLLEEGNRWDNGFWETITIINNETLMRQGFEVSAFYLMTKSTKVSSWKGFDKVIEYWSLFFQVLSVKSL